MHIRDLALSDVDQLLRFELENRLFFEQYMMPRGVRFFSLAAVQDHIRAYLLARGQGRFHGCVVVDAKGSIVARANLREINQKRGTAEIGYRVAQSHAGQGIASNATRHLIRLAYEDWHLQTLSGFVIVDNLASARVLEKNSFVRTALHRNMVKIKRGVVDCIEYLHVPA